jgi:hypothetical protein
MHSVFYLFMRETFVDWCEKVDINRLTYSSSFDTSLNAIDIGPFGVICSHLKHIDEIDILCNLYYLKVVPIIIALIQVFNVLSYWHSWLRLSCNIPRCGTLW